MCLLIKPEFSYPSTIYIPSLHNLTALGFTQPLTEMSTSNIKIIMFLGSKVPRVRRDDNLTAICEQIV
jgi:hypothetical protein